MCRHRRGSRGAGIFSAAFGLVLFLALLMFAVQVMVSLYANSVVTGAAYDAGRYVARTGDVAGGHARFSRGVGGADVVASIRVTPGADGPLEVEVAVEGRAPGFLAGRFAADLPFGTIDHTVVIRGESFRG